MTQEEQQEQQPEQQSKSARNYHFHIAERFDREVRDRANSFGRYLFQAIDRSTLPLSVIVNQLRMTRKPFYRQLTKKGYIEFTPDQLFVLAQLLNCDISEMVAEAAVPGSTVLEQLPEREQRLMLEQGKRLLQAFFAIENADERAMLFDILMHRAFYPLTSFEPSSQSVVSAHETQQE